MMNQKVILQEKCYFLAQFLILEEPWAQFCQKESVCPMKMILSASKTRNCGLKVVIFDFSEFQNLFIFNEDGHIYQFSYAFFPENVDF